MNGYHYNERPHQTQETQRHDQSTLFRASPKQGQANREFMAEFARRILRSPDAVLVGDVLTGVSGTNGKTFVATYDGSGYFVDWPGCDLESSVS